MTFLKIAQGARPMGMGEVYTAVSNDSLGLYWNPAGLSYMDVPELSAQFFSYIEDTSMQNLVYAMPLKMDKPTTIAGGITLLQSNGFKKTVIANNTYGFEEQGDFDAQDVSMHFGAGTALTPLVSCGLAVKYAQETLDNERASAAAVDVGFIFKSIDRPYRLGIVGQNIGTKVKFNKESFQLPRIVRFGVVREMPLSGWVGIEGIHASDNDLEFRAGTELPLAVSFVLRFGYKYTFNKTELGDYVGITAGLGFRFPYYLLDYAIVSYGDFGFAHRISMNVKFGKEEPAARANKKQPYPFRR